jgi:hypothetical protein
MLLEDLAEETSASNQRAAIVDKVTDDLSRNADRFLALLPARPRIHA